MSRRVLVAVHETDIRGVKAYFAQCLTCGERCHRQAHERETTAVRHARQHVCKERTS